MVKNSLEDLNNFLFGQLERLDDPDLTPEELKSEIERSDAMTSVATKIIDNANTVLKAQKVYSGSDGWVAPENRPKMLGG